jgi:hypothetical protein
MHRFDQTILAILARFSREVGLGPLLGFLRSAFLLEQRRHTHLSD